MHGFWVLFNDALIAQKDEKSIHEKFDVIFWWPVNAAESNEMKYENALTEIVRNELK